MDDLTKLIKAVRSLLNDIDDMKAPRPFDAHRSDHWFGPFSEVAEDYDFNTNVNWPNLGIAARNVNEALHDYVRGVDPRGPTPSEAEANERLIDNPHPGNPPVDGPDPGYSEY